MFRVLLIFCVFIFSSYSSLNAEKAVGLPCLLSSAPKTGTHLLEKAIQLITKKAPAGRRDLVSLKQIYEKSSNQTLKKVFFRTHSFPNVALVNTVQKRGGKILIIIRDPRDQAISMAYHDFKCRDQSKSGQELEELYGDQIPAILKDIIEGPKDTKERQFYHDFAPGKWGKYKKLNPKVVHVVKFENLVKDGATRAWEIKKLAEFLNVKLSDSAIKEITDNLIGNTKTYRNGLTEEWRRYFTEEHIHEFKENFGDSLIYMGYEKDYSW